MYSFLCVCEISADFGKFVPGLGRDLASNLAWATCAPILCRALLLAVIVRSVKTLAFSGKYLKIVESGYTQLPADVLQLKTPTLAGCRFVKVVRGSL